MVGKKPMFTKKRWALFIAFVLLFIASIYAIIIGTHIPGIYLLFGSSLGAFFLLLEINEERIFKGIWLIFFGVVVATIPSYILKNTITDPKLTLLLKSICDIVMYASAGAGGSLIAVHGDKYSTDANTNKPSPSQSCDARHIISLQDITKSQTAWIKRLCVIVGLLTLGLFLNLLRS